MIVVHPPIHPRSVNPHLCLIRTTGGSSPAEEEQESTLDGSPVRDTIIYMKLKYPVKMTLIT